MTNKFVGIWKLISWENRNQDGQIYYPYSKDVIGRLIYSVEGYMSVDITKSERPNFKSGDILGGSQEEQALAMKTYLSYFGKYEIQENKILHHVEISLFPNWINTIQERFFQFENNQLILSTPIIEMNGKQEKAYLIWEKI